MKLRTIILLGTSLIWTSFLLLALAGLTIYPGIDYFPFILIVSGIIFAGITVGWLNKILSLRLEKRNEIETSLETRTKEPERHNTRLQQEIAEHQSVENELIIHKEHLIKLTHYDNLTSLPNRVFFNEMLNKTINHASRHKKMMAILFIDLDRFKNINDAFGHPTGNLVLKEIADRLSATLRAGDVIARMGGDEFIILLNDIGHAKFASPVAEKILHSASLPITIGKNEFTLTASIGISVYPDDGTSLEDLQHNADIAMYKAKQAGSGIFQYYSKEMNLKAHEHIQMEVALRKAISNNEFVLYYQSKLNLKDGSIEGVEALVRWKNPDVGLITPSDFIPLAEETGLILQIGEWALREACQTNQAWQTEGYQPICIAVNLSAKQFQHPDIAELVKEILNESGMDPKYLELEITETAVMDDVESAIKKLNDIKKMGVQISVDDFGTGYTSISYLKKFPISGLKIDQSFIKDIPENQNNTAITSAVIALAHTLGMKVVAEGVETAEQLRYLSDNNCDIVQGYYLSRPLPEQKIILQFSKIEKNSKKRSIRKTD